MGTTCRTDKQVLALAIKTQIAFSSSVLTEVSPVKVATFMGCSYGTAKHIIEDAKNSHLFTYNSKANSLTVTGMRDKELKFTKKQKKYKEYRGEMVFKLDADSIGAMRLKELTHYIDALICINVIRTYRRDSFPMKDNSNKKYASAKRIALMTFANHLHVSVPMAHRIVTSLANSTMVEKSKGEIHIFGRANEETYDKTISENPQYTFKVTKSGLLFGAKSCSYIVNNVAHLKSVCHRIYSFHFQDIRKGEQYADSLSKELGSIDKMLATQACFL